MNHEIDNSDKRPMMFDNLDTMQENVDSFVTGNAQHNYLLFLVNLVIKVNELSISRKCADKQFSMVLKKQYEIICNAWEEQTYKLNYAVCKTFRHCGGMDLLANNCMSKDKIEQFSSARLLEQCLTTESRDYVLKNVVQKILHITCKYKTLVSSVNGLQFSFGFFENLFKHTEITFIDSNKLIGLDVLLHECQRRDVSLKQFFNALSNLWRLYGCPKNQNKIIKHNVPTRFFTLTLNTEDNIKYYIAILVTDKETKTVIIKSKIPTVIAKSKITDFKVQTQIFLEKYIPVLNSDIEKSSKASEAGIKKQVGTTSMFRARNVNEPMKKMAICSNDTTSRLAAQPCQLIVEEVPYCRRSMPVHQWSIKEVIEWFKKKGFGEFTNNLLENTVDGDLLLRLTEKELRDDIGIDNGIMKKRIMRELYNLKKSADYSNIDPTDLNSFLKSIGSEYSVYTYPMLIAGVNRDSMRFLTDDQLKNDCEISNSIHRGCIMASIKEMPVYVENVDKPYDMFISYKRSTGSELASLLAVYLKTRGYNVFIDIKRSDDANSRHNLVQTIKQSKNVIVVLTPGSLDRRILTDSLDGHIETLDLICEEVATAEQSQRNIIPVLDSNFTWPPRELLSADLKNLSNYNAISWEHKYQDACVNKLVTFMDQ